MDYKPIITLNEVGARELVTPAASEPITLIEAKNHLRVTVADDDSMLSGLITGARQLVEQITRRALLTQTWKLYLDRFPGTFANLNQIPITPIIHIPFPPLQSVTSITYIDQARAVQTLDTSVYNVDTKSTPGRIILRPDQRWPTTDYYTPNAVIIQFVAGWGDAASVPGPIKAAILLLVGHLYEHREEVMVGGAPIVLPKASEFLLMPYRDLRFA